MISLVMLFANVILLVFAYPESTATVHIQNHEGPIYVSPDRCDNPVTIGNRNGCNQGNQSPLYHSRTCETDCNHGGHQSPLYHSRTCETDCKCVTKHINTCVPINTVPQNSCTPGTFYGYPDYSYGCPVYGYGCPDNGGGQPDGRDGCKISDELIPLLKSYIGQSKCPKHGCQCGQSYISY